MNKLYKEATWLVLFSHSYMAQTHRAGLAACLERWSAKMTEVWIGSRAHPRKTWRPRLSGSAPGEAADRMLTTSTSQPKPGHQRRRKPATTVKPQRPGKSEYERAKRRGSSLGEVVLEQLHPPVCAGGASWLATLTAPFIATRQRSSVIMVTQQQTFGNTVEVQLPL